jgi:energy-coupling factor transporter ATP-binding protein EcfA2
MTSPQLVEPEDRVELSPADRYALIGKTGSGKTTFACVLATTVVPPELQAHDWEVWWLDSKGDPKDIARLQKLGYVEGDCATGRVKNQGMFRRERHGLLYFRIRERGDLSIVEQAQHLIRLAMKRRRVLVVVDEYTQIILGARSAGRALDDLFTRGRGLGIGVIGCTQEPVDIPRKLLSQAAHLCAFDLSYPRDIDYMKQYIKAYTRPPRSERHAFWHLWLDGDAIPRYYPSLRAWRSRVLVEGTAQDGSSNGSH